MTNAECETAFAELEEAVNKIGLQWVTTQVAEELRFGRTVTRKVSSRPDTPDESVLESLDERRRSKVRVSATRPYSAKERLLILLDAIERAAVATEEMESSVRDCLNRSPAGWSAIRLVRTDEANRDPLLIEAAPNEYRSRHSAALKRLISALREMI